MANSVNAEARAGVIVKKQAEANRPYHEGQEGAPHFHFPLPIESLIRELTEELPPYY